MNHAIEIRNLRKEYPTFQLKDISFDVPNGYITGFIGPNGSGKTTTIKSILNLIHYQSGEIRVLGKGGHEDRNAINGLRHYGLRTHGTGFETMVERNELMALPEGIITEELSLDEIIVFMNREANHE